MKIEKVDESTVYLIFEEKKDCNVNGGFSWHVYKIAV